MDFIVKIIGIGIVALALAYLLKPRFMEYLMEFFKEGKRIYFAGLIRFVLAIIFLLAAHECDLTGVVVFFGVLFLISGLLTFIIGLEKAKSIIEWWQKQSIFVLRLLALVTFAVGVVIIYSA
jgi:hypothetical protein